MGSGVNEGKYIKMDSQIQHLGDNKYRLKVVVWTTSELIYNYYGVRMYVTNWGRKGTLIGNFVVTNGQCSQTTFTHDFTVSSDLAVGAMLICSACEDGAHNEFYSEFHNQTVEDIAIYHNTVVPPGGSGLKVYTSKGFVPGVVKVWNGVAWVLGQVKVWNGSAWIKKE